MSLKSNEPTAIDQNRFSLFLEGARVAFNTISINEQEGIPATAEISFPSGSGALRVLPGTVVQLFGEVKNRVGVRENILLFEGEVKAVTYAKDSSQRVCTLSCHSLMMALLETKNSPNDSLIADPAFKKMSPDTNVNINIDGSITGPITNRQMKVMEKLNEQGSINNKTLKNMSFVGGTGFASFLTQKMEDARFTSGDFQGFLEEVDAYFQLHNSYYGIQSQAFKLKQSLFSFPNPAMSKGFLTPLVQQAVSDMQG